MKDVLNTIFHFLALLGVGIFLIGVSAIVYWAYGLFIRKREESQRSKIKAWVIAIIIGFVLAAFIDWREERLYQAGCNDVKEYVQEVYGINLSDIAFENEIEYEDSGRYW